MAKSKTSTKGIKTQEKSLREALKFAKKKGLFKGDLRKPMSPYRAKIARGIGDAWKNPEYFTSVKVGRGASAVAGDFVVAHGNNRVLIEKPTPLDRVSFGRKSKKITLTTTSPRTGKKVKRTMSIVSDKSGFYLVPQYRGKGKIEKLRFDTAAAAIAHIQSYSNRQLNKDQSSISKSIEEWINEIEFVEGP
jgi:hypothetical protein